MRLLDGTALCYRIFDIAEAIDLEKAKALLSQGSARMALTREGSQFIQFANPPLTVALGKIALPLRSGEVTADVTARVFDHGALSIIFRVPLKSGTTLEELIPFADEIYDAPCLDPIALEQTNKLRGTLAAALEDPHLWDRTESYTVLMAKKLEGDPDGATLLSNRELPRLILGENKEPQLSDAEEKDVLSHAFRYTPKDLAVIDWNSAFVYEPSGSEDIPDLLEVANAQLLEFRYFDDVLDRELTRVYEQIGRKRPGGVFYSPWKKLLRDLTLTIIELSEFIERVENTLRIVADTYLARVYEGAVEQLRIKRWQEQVDRKRKLLEKAYELMKGEVDTRRALTLETSIVLLIVFEVLMGLAGLAK